MSRMPAGNKIEIRPSNNVYTALAGTALIAVIFALVTLFLRASALGVKIF
jgi:hypothetical protein